MPPSPVDDGAGATTRRLWNSPRQRSSCRRPAPATRRGLARTADAASDASTQDAMRTSIESLRAGMTMGTRAPSTMPAARPAIERHQRAQHHQRRFHRRRDQHVDAPGDLGCHAVGARRVAGQRAVRRQRAVDDGAAEHALRRHRLQRDGIGRRRKRGRRTVHRREQRDVGCREPERNRQLDRVLHDVALGGEVGRHVQLRVGQQQAARTCPAGRGRTRATGGGRCAGRSPVRRRAPAGPRCRGCP